MGKKARAGDGQPRSNRRRMEEAVTIRLLPAQKAELESKAAVFGMKLTSYLRRVALTDRPIKSARVNQAALAELSRVTYQLNKVGVLINQIARACNTTGQILSPEQFSELVADLKTITGEAANQIRSLSDLDEGDGDDT